MPLRKPRKSELFEIGFTHIKFKFNKLSGKWEVFDTSEDTRSFELPKVTGGVTLSTKKWRSVQGAVRSGGNTLSLILHLLGLQDADISLYDELVVTPSLNVEHVKLDPELHPNGRICDKIVTDGQYIVEGVGRTADDYPTWLADDGTKSEICRVENATYVIHFRDIIVDGKIQRYLHKLYLYRVFGPSRIAETLALIMFDQKDALAIQGPLALFFDRK